MGKKISELSVAAALTGAERVPLLQGGTTFYATVEDIRGTYANPWKAAVVAASTANVVLATAVENGDTLDGVTLATGDRILLKNQTTASENGIYVVAASGAPTRALDANAEEELINAVVYVSEGTTNADTAWVCTTNSPITVGSTSLTWAQTGAGGGGTPGGSDTQVQYNASSAFAGSARLTFDYTNFRLGTRTINLGSWTTFDANKLSGDDEHWLNITNDPAVVAGGSGAGRQLMRVNSYASGGYGGNVNFCRYRGTEAAPTAVQSGDTFMSFGMRGWDSGGALSQSAASFAAVATENWTGSAHGIKWVWQVTPNGSTTSGNGMELTSTGLAVTGDVSATGKILNTEAIIVACSDETTALTTGVGKVAFRMPYAFTLSSVRASLTTAQTSGSTFTVDINESGTSILSTKLTIDNTEKTSTTAATAAVISDTALADDAEITVDIDTVGDGTAKGLKIMLIGKKA